MAMESERRTKALVAFDGENTGRLPHEALKLRHSLRECVGPDSDVFVHARKAVNLYNAARSVGPHGNFYYDHAVLSLKAASEAAKSIGHATAVELVKSLKESLKL